MGSRKATHFVTRYSGSYGRPSHSHGNELVVSTRSCLNWCRVCTNDSLSREKALRGFGLGPIFLFTGNTPPFT
jgi:hypothetical protein